MIYFRLLKAIFLYKNFNIFASVTASRTIFYCRTIFYYRIKF